MITSRAEIEQQVRPAGAIGEFLANRYAGHVADDIGVSKVIWDMAAVGWVLDDSWATTVLAPSPVLTDGMTWSRDEGRHLIGEVVAVRRDAIFGDFFTRLSTQRG
jgi:hypothetical protein